MNTAVGARRASQCNQPAAGVDCRLHAAGKARRCASIGQRHSITRQPIAANAAVRSSRSGRTTAPTVSTPPSLGCGHSQRTAVRHALHQLGPAEATGLTRRQQHAADHHVHPAPLTGRRLGRLAQPVAMGSCAPPRACPRGAAAPEPRQPWLRTHRSAAAG